MGTPQYHIASTLGACAGFQIRRRMDGWPGSVRPRDGPGMGWVTSLHKSPSVAPSSEVLFYRVGPLCAELRTAYRIWGRRLSSPQPRPGTGKTTQGALYSVLFQVWTLIIFTIAAPGKRQGPRPLEMKGAATLLSTRTAPAPQWLLAATNRECGTAQLSWRAHLDRIAIDHPLSADGDFLPAWLWPGRVKVLPFYHIGFLGSSLSSRPSFALCRRQNPFCFQFRSRDVPCASVVAVVTSLERLEIVSGFGRNLDLGAGAGVEVSRPRHAMPF